MRKFEPKTRKSIYNKEKIAEEPSTTHTSKVCFLKHSLPSNLFFYGILFCLLIGTALRITIDLYARDPFLIKIACSPKNTTFDIILFGDSVIASTANSDKDERSISEMLIALEPYSLLDLAEPGRGLLRFRRAAQLLKFNQVSADLSIIEFDASALVQVFDRVAYQLSFFYGEKPKIWLNLASAPLIEAILLDKSTRTKPQFLENEKEEESSNIKKGISVALSSNARPQEQKIDMLSSRIASSSLRALLKSCMQISKNILVYATPINMEHQSPTTRIAINRNMSIAKNICEAEGIKFLDFHNTLDTSYFTDSSDVHMDERGRLYVAKKIFEAIQTLPISFEKGKPTVQYNDIYNL